MDNMGDITKFDYNLRYVNDVAVVDTIALTDTGVEGIYANANGIIVEYDDGTVPCKIFNAVKAYYVSQGA